MKHFRISCRHFPVGEGVEIIIIKGTSLPLLLQQILNRKHQPQIIALADLNILITTELTHVKPCILLQACLPVI